MPESRRSARSGPRSLRFARWLIGFGIAMLAAVASTADAGETPRRVYIVHGYGASPADHWFAWLARALEREGVAVTIVDLPTPSAPTPEAWQRALREQIRTPDAHTWFVAHSLGSIALLRYLAESTDTDTDTDTAGVGGFVLVSGFNTPLPALPQLDGFIVPALDTARLIRLAPQRIVVAAEDDAIVSHASSRALAEALDARFVSVARGGHFLASDGYTRFPLLLELIEGLPGFAR